MAAIAIILSLKPLEANKLQYITNDLPPLPNYLQGVGELFIIGLSIGLQGGLKYTIPAVGTAYFDVGGQYSILGQANNATASNTNQYSQLFFVFTVGFRKDLY